ncbi:GIY-YIG nuclease superfamily protein [Gimesia alba]|uniref:GIY-YIG nuclease superfamily protein n=2 Tax=Gimesia alba TaxID=2527973 RepID=A0A517RDI3_9PLAN|nr:GIY-YIG nuclease superfamily protein [Gimesia alba]
MIFRLSHKLNQKIKTGTLTLRPLNQNPFADWSCRLFTADRRQYILLSNTKSLYSCLMTGKGITNQRQFTECALNCIRDFTAADTHQQTFEKFIASERESIQFAKALNHSVTSSMNLLVEYAQDLLIEQQIPLLEVSYELNDYLTSAIVEKKSDSYCTPNEAFQRMLHLPIDLNAMGLAEAELKNDRSAETPTVWFVYILRCADRSLYTGITTDLTRRCQQHNTGTGARYTRSRLPVSIEYHETQASRSAALKRELEIKAMSRAAKEALISSNNR